MTDVDILRYFVETNGNSANNTKKFNIMKNIIIILSLFTVLFASCNNENRTYKCSYKTHSVKAVTKNNETVIFSVSEIFLNNAGQLDSIHTTNNETLIVDNVLSGVTNWKVK